MSSKEISFVPVVGKDGKTDKEASLKLCATFLDQYSEVYDGLAEKTKDAVEKVWEESLPTVEHLNTEGIRCYTLPLLGIAPTPENIDHVDNVINQVMSSNEKFLKVGLGRDAGFWYSDRIKNEDTKKRITAAAKKTTERDAKAAEAANADNANNG